MKNHIKHIFRTLLAMVFVLSLQAQEFRSYNEDSLKNLLANSRKDTARADILNKLSESYRFKNPDSAVFFGDKALELARELNFKKGMLDGLHRSGDARRPLGRYAEAIRMHQELLQLSEELNDQYHQAMAIGFIGISYNELHEYDRAIKFLRRALDMLASQRPQFNEAFFSIHLGDTYVNKKIPDSAFYFLRTSERRFRLRGIPSRVSKLMRLGNAFASIKIYDSAIYYYRKALRIASQRPEEVPNGFSGITKGLSDVFALQNQLDSAFYFGRLSFKTAEKANVTGRTYESSLLMSKLHRQIGNRDSTLYYQDIAIARKDSIFGEKSNREFQLLLLEEQRRALEAQRVEERFQNNILIIGLVTITTIILAASILLFRSNRIKQKTNLVLQQTLNELKATQSQLIQSEKMASLGELTAGIAHEIQNPLNFVNNFAEVNKELIADMEAAIQKGNVEEAKDLARNIADNQEKINSHGKRADAIVKSMLQHSRTSSGQKEMTDLNELCDEYLRLTYHGYRAKDKSFNAKLNTQFDPSLPKVNVVRQDIGRVLLNLINNAFYAINEKSAAAPTHIKAMADERYEPIVTVSTKVANGKIEICVRDNGRGIPESLKEKIFQPFFTTKPTGQGTGLGLSLSYDIVKAHGGELIVRTNEGSGSEFIIRL